MGRSNEAILADLNSGDPPRIQQALSDLKQRMNEVDEFPLIPFGAEILAPFGDSVPEETQLDFITVVRKYRSFVPELTPEKRLASMIAVVLRYPEGYVAFEVALRLKTAPQPARAVAAAMQEVVRQGLLSPQNVKGAGYLVSRLLDGKDEVRKATLENLRLWPKAGRYLEVKDYITPQLDPDELKFLREV
jgi:hypothetical protein